MARICCWPRRVELRWNDSSHSRQAAGMTALEVRLALKRLRLRQWQFAALLGVHRVTVGRWVTGEAEVPKYVSAYLELAEREESALKSADNELREMLGKHYGQFNTKQEIEDLIGRKIMWPDQQQHPANYANLEAYLQQATGINSALFNAQAQFSTPVWQQANPPQPNLLAPYYEYQVQLERERFFRSCSQGWLDAMLDIELGLA